MVKQGRIMLHGDRPPYGYRVSEDGSTLVIHEPEARIVRQIFAWYTEGDETGKRLSSVKIAQRLSALEVPTWSDIHGIFQKRRGYGKWSTTIVLDVLHSETYKGQWHYGRRNGTTSSINPREEWITLPVPAIVTPEVWAKAQEYCQENKTKADRNVKREYLLRSRAACQCGYGVQGCTVSFKRKSGVKGVYQYYRCNSTSMTTVSPSCRLPSFRVDQVDAVIWAWVRSLLQNPVDLIRGVNLYQEERQKENAPIRARLAVLEDLISSNRQQLERLLDLYLRGDFPKDVLTDRRVRLESTIAALEKERVGFLAHLQADTLTEDQIRTLQNFVAEVAAGLEAADQDFPTRRRVIEALDLRATLAVEDEQKVVYVTCVLGKIGLNVVDCSPHYSKWGTSQRSSTE